MLFGYLLSRFRLSRKYVFGALFVFILVNIWVVLGTISLSDLTQIAYGIYANYFFNRISLPMILLSLSAFVLLRACSQTIHHHKLYQKLVPAFSAVALGMCMTYPYWFIILGTEKVGIELTAFAGNPLWSVPLTALLTIFGSFTTVYIIKKIPYLNTIVPKLY